MKTALPLIMRKAFRLKNNPLPTSTPLEHVNYQGFFALGQIFGHLEQVWWCFLFY